MHNNEQVNLLIDVLVVNHIEVCRAVCRPAETALVEI
jgi:cob(I)alamin adenosyltransferase